MELRTIKALKKMTTTNHTTTFWNFLKNHEVEIPIIQRDYAQGRIGKESLRKNFLIDLKEALDKKEEMKLDFVYGSTENGKLYPLDGQQRLTTLWLLHWYIALKAGKLKDASVYLKKFSYETRVSSRNFCEEMCEPNNFENYYYNNSVVEFITNQTWFYSAWKQDPTIQSMLRMLGGSKHKSNIDDGIEKVFDCCSCIKNRSFTEETNLSENCQTFVDYYNNLTGDGCPIVFYYLPKDFGNSDDLYIKMNARGEQLTSFENFKADLIGYIKKQAENDSNWEALLDSKEGFPIKMDTNWTDVFWKYKSKGTSDCRMINRIDDIYFAFINRFFWNELFITKDKDDKYYILDIGKGDENSTKENDNASYKYLNDSDNPNDYDTKIAYKGFDVYKYDNRIIPFSFFEKMKNVLNNVSAYIKDNTIPECSWNKEFFFIPRYYEDKDNNIEITNNVSDRILKVTTLNQIQRIVFFSICKYFNHDNTITDDDKSLKRWLRVVWNLVSGEDENGRPQIRSTQAVRTAIGFIENLHSHDVYKSLISYPEDVLSDSDFDERCKEEIAKAKQILDENNKPREYNGVHKKEDGSDYNTWEDIINEAEKYAFFKGAIRFLYTNNEGTPVWNDFDTKWSKVKNYFDEEGKIVEDYKNNAILLRALLSRIDIGEKWFGYDKEFWRKSLLSKGYQSAIHDLLTTNELKIKEDCKHDWIKNNDLLNTLLVDDNKRWHILNNWQDFSVLTKYSRRRSDANSPEKIVVLNDLRNRLLDNNIISTDNRIKETSYLYGWNINFKYKDRFFQWNGLNEKELDVYLMEENWTDYKRRLNPTNDKHTEEDTHFCFRVDKDTKTDTFVKKLDCLIAQAFPEESDKACCNDCQNKVCE